MSSTSLYGNVSNVTVSSKNLTTLYNATTGTTVVANVPDRNFTTLYAAAGQTDIKPTLPYGNANVEAFLNIGHDGANMVQNITVNGESFLGPVGNVHITGGTLNYILSTDGDGGLSWIPQSGIGAAIPYIHFDVPANGIGQSFTDSNLQYYADVNEMNVMKNGVNIEPFYYSLSGTTLTINIWLSAGDTVDVLATGLGVRPGGNITEVQYNGGSGLLAGNASFTYDQANGLLTVPIVSTNTINTIDITSSNITSANITATYGNIITLDTTTITNQTFTSDDSNIGNLIVNTSANLGDVANINIYGGTSGYVLSTDGAGTLSWVAQTGGGGNGTPGGANSQLQFNNSGVFGGVGVLTYNGANVSLNNVANLKIPGGLSGQTLTTYGNGTMYWDTVVAGPGGNTTEIQYNNGGVLDGTSVLTFNGSNVTISNVNNFKIPGGSSGQILTTYGNGTIYWSTVSGGGNAATSLTASIGNVVITGGTAGDLLATYGNGVLYWDTVNQLSGVTNSNVVALGNNAANLATGSAVLIGDNAAALSGGVAVGANAYAPGQYAISIGKFAGSGSIAPNNIILGSVSGAGLVGANNIVLGSNAATSFNTGNRNIIIGYEAQSSLGANDEITLGGSTTTSTRIPYGNLAVYNGINVGTGFSNVTIYNGNVNASYFIGDGSYLSNITANYAPYAGNITIGAQPNITSTGTLTSLNVTGTSTFTDVTVTGNLTMQRGFEPFTTVGSGSSGTVTFDVITQSILYYTGTATANCTVNVQGSGAVTLDSLLPTNDSLTIVFLNTVGGTAYINNVLSIDGTAQAVKWVNGLNPSVGTRLTYAVQSYTYTIMKTASNTYTCIGSLTEYQ